MALLDNLRNGIRGASPQGGGPLGLGIVPKAQQVLQNIRTQIGNRPKLLQR